MQKSNVKYIARKLAKLIALPLVLSYKLASKLCDQDMLFASCTQALSLIPGKFGSYIRVGYLSSVTDCSEDVVIQFGTIFSHQDITISEGAYIGAHCNIGTSIIERDCLLGSGVHILSGKEQHFANQLDKPMREQGGYYKKIRIGADTWIGNGALVMDDVGKHCIIGAGSVVVKEIPDYAVSGGNPAKVLKLRVDERRC